MAETVYMTIDDLRQFQAETARIAVRETFKTIERNASKEVARKRNIKAVKDKLAAYRRHKRNMEEDIDFTPAEKFEYRFAFLQDLMGVMSLDASYTEDVLIAREEQRRKVRYELLIIDKAIEKFRQEIEETGDEIRSRWFTVMYDFYINDKASNMVEISERLNISKATAWRDLDNACGVILEYLV